ncbi:NADPH-adrenodoxin reductase, partial [Serendipita sp. 398]
MSSLRAHYSHIVLAYGAGLPFVLPALGSSAIPALSLVHWYTGHPSNPVPPPLDKTQHMTLMGHGNVSLDIARLFLSSSERIAPLDIPRDAQDIMSTSKLEHISIASRRGPAQVAFTAKELRELLNLPDVSMSPIDPRLLEPPPGGASRQQSRILDLLRKGSAAKFEGGVEFGINELDEAQRAVPTGETETHKTDLVVNSVGYRSEPVEVNWYDGALGRVRQSGGRVMDSEGNVLERVYTSGWAANGAKGVLATTMMDAYAVAERLLEDSIGQELPSDHVESLRMSWSGKDNNDVLKAASFVRYTIHSKGPFVALIGLGEARHVLQLVAREHDLMETSPDPDLLPNSGPYPITILTPTLYTTFYIVEPEPFSEDVFAPFPTTVLPNNAILSIVKNVIASGKKMFDRPIMPLAELRAAKLTRRAILLAAAKQKEEDVNAWKELKRRKEMGEDVELPERPISGRQRRRREKMEKRMAEIWGDEESPNQEYPSNLFEVAPVPKPAEVFQSSEISDKISNYVLQPTAEPVVTCEVNLLNEMIQWLEKDEDIVASQEPRIDFVRGSILGKTTVGGGTSVDLCKQVVGPKGIKPILDAVAKNSHIDRFLLGNNIVGDEGAKVIADFIRDEKSKRVYNFYIAGNSISPVGIGEIANALCTNTTVTALWLKRNPLLTE